MTVPRQLHHYSFRDYLLVEESNPIRHEFLNGEIYAMAGGTILHAALTVAASSALHRQLAGRCRVFSSDLRIRSLATGLACYPDVTVVCGNVETDPESKETVANPTAIVEVLSPATIDYDLGEKFDHYSQIPSLKAVVYVWQDRRQMEIRERTEEGGWRTLSAVAGRAALESLQVFVDVDKLYDDASGPASG
jgi:Uma2 family endonuclease